MSAAVLFYGYNLGAPEDSGWALKGDTPGFRADTDFEPEWLTEAEAADEDLAEAMRRTILIASDVPESEAVMNRVPGFSLDDLLAKRCGVRLLTCGHSNSPFYGLALADTVHRADDWTPKCIAPTTRCASTEPLARALEALDMKPAQLNPSWILAPEEF
jgi:hypothetical protein